MNLVQALAIVTNCARIKKLAGVNADYPYTVDQVAEAAMAIENGLQEEIVRLRVMVKQGEMQLRAANARAAKHAT